MIKLEFPADRPDIARALGSALLNIAGPATEGGDYEETPKSETLTSGSTTSPTEGLQSADTAATTSITSESASAESPKSESLFDAQPGGTAEGVAKAGTAPQTTPPEGARADAPRDTKGVAFDSNYCGQAKDPYYSTGKRTGQWKKRKGVDDKAYDGWYASQLTAAPEAVGDGATDDTAAIQSGVPVNTAAAFGAQPDATNESAAEVPQDMGTFMGWVSENQAADNLTQEDVNAAYATAGLQLSDLFTGTPDVISGNIAKLHGILSAKIGA